MKSVFGIGEGFKTLGSSPTLMGDGRYTRVRLFFSWSVLHASKLDKMKAVIIRNQKHVKSSKFNERNMSIYTDTK